MSGDNAPIDQQARDRIERDLNTSFAVEAGAGTGKTTVLTGRIVEAIRTGRARMDEVVAITFTERAASELKVRLRDELEGLQVETEGQAAQRISDALAALDTAHTSTIHSFASEILRERPVEAGVDPGFEIGDEMETSLLFEQVWANWLDRELNNEDGALSEAFLAGLTVGNVRDLAFNLREYRDLELPGEEVHLTNRLEDFRSDFVPKARQLYVRMQQKCASPSCSCVSRILAAVRAADEIKEADHDDMLARISSIPPLGAKQCRNACKDKNTKDACKAGLNELEDLVADLRDPASHMLVHRLAGLVRGMLDEYAAAKRDRAVLDFDDLLLKARNLLRDNRRVRAYFQRRFKMILVDECQDTDPLQTEIVFFLAEDGATADTWRDVSIVPGKLLFVGDPKQSIYRFRHADVEAYEEAKQVVRRSGELVNISENFRSSASCVGWVNAVFGELIGRPENGAYQPDYVPLAAWRKDAAAATTVLRPPAGEEFSKIDDARTAEAAAVAAHINQMVGDADEVFDKDTHTMRPVRFGDFALLFHKRLALGAYEAALSGLGVPFRTVSGKDFFARQEVVELRVLLAAVERPYDAAAVVAALRTSLLGVSDDELAAVAGDFDYLKREQPGSAYLCSVFDRLAGWHRARSSQSISGLVQDILSDTKALQLFYLKPNGEQRAANLTKVVDAARAYEQKPGATFGGFVRWLEERTHVAKEADSPLTEEAGDFVKLMTIHQAKGLEFHVVALPDISWSSHPNNKFVVNPTEGTFDARLGSKDEGIQTIGFAKAEEREKRAQEAERLRLLYVAATRARDRLIVPYFPSKGKPEGYLKYLAEIIDDATGAVREYQAEVITRPEDLKVTESAAFRVDLSGKPPAGCAALHRQREDWEDERKQLIRSASAGKRLRAASSLRTGEHEDFGLAAGGGEPARSIGDATHAVLEQLDLATGADLAAVAQVEALRSGMPEQCRVIERLAKNALDMPLVRRAAEASKLYREVPFAVSASGAVLEGVIDLAFDDGHGLTIADYKTDDVPEEQLSEHATQYRLQIGAYALAAAEVFGELPVSASLLFLRSGSEIPVEINSALIERVKAEL